MHLRRHPTGGITKMESMRNIRDADSNASDDQENSHELTKKLSKSFGTVKSLIDSRKERNEKKI